MYVCVFVYVWVCVGGGGVSSAEYENCVLDS